VKQRVQYLWAAVRIGFGWVFLWAFLDKLLGLGFPTRPEQAWLAGASPTVGYLANATAGPLSGLYRSIAGAAWVDWSFMLGLLALGVALLLGVAVRLAGCAGALLMLMIWSSHLPPAQNPIIDEHIIYALTLLALAASRAGDTLGLGRWWARRTFAQ
jgi:uncharacterized membrane protein YphA (DoxX/SURF4 family)